MLITSESFDLRDLTTLLRRGTIQQEYTPDGKKTTVTVSLDDLTVITRPCSCCPVTITTDHMDFVVVIQGDKEKRKVNVVKVSVTSLVNLRGSICSCKCFCFLINAMINLILKAKKSSITAQIESSIEESVTTHLDSLDDVILKILID